MKSRPTHVECLIVGGGIAGASVAYHLAGLGLRDVALFERDRLTSGSTWHAAGLIMQLRGTHMLTGLAKYNVELYASLSTATGQATGFKQNGTLGVCRTRDRLTEARRVAGIAASFGIEAHIVDAREAQRLYPAIDRSLVEGAIFIPKDGQTNPVDTCLSLIRGAKNGGVSVFEDTPVTALRRLSNGHYEATTLAGTTVCEKIVLACGLWTRGLASQLRVRVPLYPCEHFYVVTESADFAHRGLPVLRDVDGHIYLKEEAGKILIGAFEPFGKAIDWSALPRDQSFIELEEDWEHFELPFTKAAQMVPALEDFGIQKFFNGPESFTPDLLFMIGEAPGAPNCFISAGYNSEGIEYGAGAGRALAEWIVNGSPTTDLADVDVARFHPFHNNRRYLRARVPESLGLHYKMHWPHKQRLAGRPARKSPLHDRLAAMRGAFGEAMGWERPLWYAQEGEDPVDRHSYEWPNWFDAVARETESARHDVVFFDQSSFGKHLVQGPDACAFLQRLCAGNVDVPPGRIVYTHFLNELGGVEADLTVNRLDEWLYLIISSATTQPRDRAWMEARMHGDEHVTLTDVTSAYSVLSVQGPKSRALLSRLTDADLSADAFPFSTSQEIDIGFARAIINRLTYIGELGFELFIPSEFAQDVFDLTWAEGQQFGLRPAGYHALEHMRLERGYREYQLDLTPEDTLRQAGLAFTIDYDKPVDFIGRDAVLRERMNPTLTKRIVQLKLASPRRWLYRDEPIWCDGAICGYVSSGAYGFTVRAGIGMGYVRHQDGVTNELIENSRFEIEIAGERIPAVASLSPFYNPKGTRVRS